MTARLIGFLTAVSAAFFLLGAAESRAQNLLPNAGFEAGTNTPVGWILPEGTGQWSEAARSGRHSVNVEGNGQNSFAWRTERLGFAPGALYRMRFAVKGDPGAAGGLIVSGVSRVNRDFHATDSWQEHTFVFSFPHDVTNDFARLGQWELKGRVSFDDAELLPVLATHARLPGDAELGEAESVRDGVYRFAPILGWAGANAHRTLIQNRASFNSDRWVFSHGSELVYRVGVRGVPQRSATLRLALNYHTAGTLIAEAARVGGPWEHLGTLGATNRSGQLTLPSAQFPVDEIQVRLRAEGAGASFQVNTFEYEAPLANSIADVEGQTRFLAVRERSHALAVQLIGSQLTLAGDWGVDCWLSNLTDQPLDLQGSAQIVSGSPPSLVLPLRLTAHSSSRAVLTVPLTKPGADKIQVQFTEANRNTLFAGETEVNLPTLLDPRPGYWLAESETLGVWWCESGWKIGRERHAPGRDTTQPIHLAAARGEFEAAQVILRPVRDGELRAVTLGPLRDATGVEADITATLDEVAYVNVTHPTDATCDRGWYPDPLPPLRTPLQLRAGKNQPLWLTLHVGREAKAGTYRGELWIDTSGDSARVPVELQVYDFALPKETHLASGFGLGTHEINRYHGLKTASDMQAVFDKYLQNFAEHRISPYSFFDYAPIDVRFTGTGAEKRAEVDFTKFDVAARRWLDEAGFNAFRLPLRGMGGGTFHSRSLGRLEGFEEGTPEHARLFGDYLGQVVEHLRERGWLGKAYTYWFDEPDRKDYAFVVAGNQRIRAAAPGLRRLLTEQPEAELLGHVEIWCGLTPEWTPDKVRARRAAGESVWWYICTAPKAPYVTEFIDHPGTELRLWPWQSWQYGVDGLLVWATVYWNSSAAFPAPRIQDPWSDPMSYVSDYDFKPGQIGYWGNGDGRFLYPPRRDPTKSTEPNLDRPVNSVRWENLRDGMEDYEYFWRLQRTIEVRSAAEGESDLLREARTLLTVPAEISKDLTHFTTDPRLMLQHRDRMARMIEKLEGKRGRN